MMENNTHTFKARIVRLIWGSDTFKIYASEVDGVKYPEIKKNSYGNVTIVGSLPELSCGIEYQVTGIERDSKYGKEYLVENYQRIVPTNEEDTRIFLQEIISENQTEQIMTHYPNIIELIRDGKVNDIDTRKLKGIKEKILSKIVNKITENFCLFDLVAEFQNCIDLSIIRKIYAEYETVERTRSELRKNPYDCLCRLARIGFKTADNILLDMEYKMNQLEKDGKSIPIKFHDLRTSEQRCLACIVYNLRENESDGNTKMNLAELRKKVISLANECIDKFSEAIKNEKIYYNIETMEVALKHTRDIEEYIAKRIFYALNNSIKYDGIDVKSYKNIAECELSDEQVCAIKNVCDYNISILNGAAGCGKSFSTQAIIKMLDDLGKSYIIMSPTGKAAKVISEYTNRKAFTIHRGLKYNPSGFGSWGYNKDNPLTEDVVIVDEFSMTDIHLFRRLLDAIDFEHTKLLLIGDNAQLPSVGCGNLLHDFMESGVVPMTTLTKVFRYGEGGLMKVATDTRFCKPYLNKEMSKKCTGFGKNNDYYFIDVEEDKIIMNLIGLYKKLLKDGVQPSDIQVLTAKNVGDIGTIALNNSIQKIANPNYGDENNITKNDTSYFVGDIVMQKQNNYKAIILDDDYCCDNSENDNKPTAFVANGEMGTIVDIKNEVAVIDFNGISVVYKKTDMQNVSLGYAITVHKSQGSSSPYVIIVTPKSHTFMLNSNLLYVGLTRMKEKCYHIGNLYTVNNAIKKKANFQRSTFMQQMLKNNNQ